MRLLEQHFTGHYAVIALVGVFVEKLKELKLAQTASALAFVTVLSIVPLLTVGFALLTAFPVFGEIRTSIDSLIVSQLLPESVGSVVLRYLNEFAGKASTLSALGIGMLTMSAMSMLNTLQTTLNSIWQAERQRSMVSQMILIWSMLTLGPLFLGAGAMLSSQLTTWLAQQSDASFAGIRWLKLLGWLSVAFSFTLLYRLMPECEVKWRHAWIAGLVASLGFQLVKLFFGGIIASAPTYQTVYGALAVLPVLFIWIWLCWGIVLFGAVLAAVLPSWQKNRTNLPKYKGAGSVAVLSVCHALSRARLSAGQQFMSTDELAEQTALTQVDLVHALAMLRELNWVGTWLVDEQEVWILTVDPSLTPLSELLRRLWFDWHVWREDERAAPILGCILQGWSGVEQETLASWVGHRSST